MIIAERNGVILRHARDEDLPLVDEITIICYTPIQESYVAMLGEECCEAVRHNPELTWEERKTGQVHRLLATRQFGPINRAKTNRDRQSISQASFNRAKADLEDAQVTAISPVYQTSLAILDSF